MTPASAATADAAPRGLVCRGICYRLPPGAREVEEPPRALPLPGAPAGLLGLALQGGRGAAVWALSTAPRAWVAFDLQGSTVVCGGDALREPPADAPMIEIPAAEALPLAAWVPPPRLAPEPPPRARAAPRPGTYLLSHGRHGATVPFGVLDGVLDMPDLAPGTDPGLPPGALGVAEFGGRFALLLDPARWLGPDRPSPTPPRLVALLRLEDRLLAIPVDRALPGDGGARLDDALAGTPEGRALLAAAPRAAAPRARTGAEESTRFLLCETGGVRFAVPAADVATVLGRARPAPLPAEAGLTLRGIVSHQGEVLPVVDLDPRLAPPMHSDLLVSALLLRLPLPRPLAVPVERVLGLHAIPLTRIEAVSDDPLVSGRATLEGRAVPICRAAALPAPAGAP